MNEKEINDLKLLLRRNTGRITPSELRPFIKNAIEELKAGRPFGFQQTTPKLQLRADVQELLENRMAEYAAGLISQMIDSFSLMMMREIRRCMVIGLRGYDPATGTLNEESMAAIKAPLPKPKDRPSHPLGWKMSIEEVHQK